MAPSAKKLEAALLQATRDVYQSGDRANLSVNFVRKKVQDQFDLDDGFFLQGTWKSRSKQLIKDLASSLLDNDSSADPEPGPSTSLPVKTENGLKRHSSEEPDTPKTKRHKKEESKTPTPRKKTAAVKKSSYDTSDEDHDAKKTKKKKLVSRRQSRQVVASDDDTSPEKIKLAKDEDGDAGYANGKKEESEGAETSPVKKRGADSSEDEKPRVKKRPVDDSDEEDKPPRRVKKRAANSDDEEDAKVPAAKPEVVEEENDEAKELVNEEEEYSDVIDEPPTPRRKGKGKEKASASKSSAAAKSKGKKPAKASSSRAKTSEPDDAESAEIKKLQGQLVKCGVRKIWGVELKPYSDGRAKIRHLREMLADIGMDGRFSEAKAREIREARELAEELAAVTTMNAHWGIREGESRPRRGTRAAAAKPKGTFREPDTDEEEAQEGEGADGGESRQARSRSKNVVRDEDDEESGGEVFARNRGSRADFAFLGDDDEEDSD